MCEEREGGWRGRRCCAAEVTGPVSRGGLCVCVEGIGVGEARFPLRGRAGGVILCEESPGGKALE